MDSLNHGNQADVIEAFNSTYRYIDDLLNIDNPYFEGMVNHIYPPELTNTTYTEAPFLDLHISVANGFVILFGSMLPNPGGHWRGFGGRDRGVAHPLSRSCVRCSWGILVLIFICFF